MKPIIFNETNKTKIEKLLDEEQKTARVRCIEVKEMERMIKEAEDYLDIPKKYLEGTVIDCDYHAQTFPNCYKGVPESTQFGAKFENGKWRIIWIGRYITRRAGHKFEIELSDSAKEAIIKRFSTK